MTSPVSARSERQDDFLRLNSSVLSHTSAHWRRALLTGAAVLALSAAAGAAVASLSQVIRPGDSLLPSIKDLRRVSSTVALAVATAAEADGVAQRPLTHPVEQVYDAMWQPEYPELIID